MRKIIATVTVGLISLAIGAFAANAATKTPPGFYEGKAEWKDTRHPRPPGWNKGEKEGWGTHKTAPPGLKR